MNENLPGLLLNAMYQAAEGDSLAQRMIVAIAQGYNDRMAEINHTEPVKALEEAR